MVDIVEKINLSLATASDVMRHIFSDNLAMQSERHSRLQAPTKLLCCDVADPRFLVHPNNNVPPFVQFDI